MPMIPRVFFFTLSDSAWLARAMLLFPRLDIKRWFIQQLGQGGETNAGEGNQWENGKTKKKGRGPWPTREEGSASKHTGNYNYIPTHQHQCTSHDDDEEAEG